MFFLSDCVDCCWLLILMIYFALVIQIFNQIKYYLKSANNYFYYFVWSQSLFYLIANLDELTTKWQLYPKSTTIDGIGRKNMSISLPNFINKCTKPISLNLFNSDVTATLIFWPFLLFRREKKASALIVVHYISFLS